ncbi:MAG: hypothetical protein ACE5NA_00225 [Nitrospiraceae bacterium]
MTSFCAPNRFSLTIESDNVVVVRSYVKGTRGTASRRVFQTESEVDSMARAMSYILNVRGFDPSAAGEQPADDREDGGPPYEPDERTTPGR